MNKVQQKNFIQYAYTKNYGRRDSKDRWSFYTQNGAECWPVVTVLLDLTPCYFPYNSRIYTYLTTLLNVLRNI